MTKLLIHVDRLRDAEKAEEHYDHAMALAEEPSMRPLWAHYHLGLGMLYRTGGRTSAEDHLANGATLCREMGMGFWLEKA